MMLADDVPLQRSNAGEIHLYDSRDQFHACFKNGQWYDNLIFDAYDLEAFDLIEDEEDIGKPYPLPASSCLEH